jgi:hypothetical protein
MDIETFQQFRKNQVHLEETLREFVLLTNNVHKKRSDCLKAKLGKDYQ